MCICLAERLSISKRGIFRKSIYRSYPKLALKSGSCVGIDFKAHSPQRLAYDTTGCKLKPTHVL